MLLTQNDDGFDEVEHPNDVQVTWGVEVLPRWKQMIERCMDRNPNERPLLGFLVKFWKAEEMFMDSRDRIASARGQ